MAVSSDSIWRMPHCTLGFAACLLEAFTTRAAASTRARAMSINVGLHATHDRNTDVMPATVLSTFDLWQVGRVLIGSILYSASDLAAFTPLTKSHYFWAQPLSTPQHRPSQRVWRLGCRTFSEQPGEAGRAHVPLAPIRRPTFSRSDGGSARPEATVSLACTQPAKGAGGGRVRRVHQSA